MGLGALTKEFAKQALGDQVKDVMDSLRPADLATVAENLSGVKPPAPAVDSSVGSIVVGQIQAMQHALKDEQELVVLCATGVGTLRILEVFVPSWRVAVLTGIDTEKVVTRVVCPFDTLELVCKPMAVAAGAKPVRLRFVTPKP